MSGGHGHDLGHGHDAGHGHGSAAGAGAAHDGPHEIPPMPADPFISPARADYEQPWPGRLLLWPFFWSVFAVLCWVGARSWDHPVLQGEHGAEHAEEHGAEHGPAHEAPGIPHEAPAMGEHSR